MNFDIPPNPRLPRTGESYRDYTRRALAATGHTRAERRATERRLYSLCRQNDIPVNGLAMDALEALGRLAHQHNLAAG